MTTPEGVDDGLRDSQVDRPIGFPARDGDKYALIALDAATTFDGVLSLGDGYFAVCGHRFELPTHWKEWLGTLATEAITRANLLLVATMPSENPTVLDAENQLLLRRAGFLYWGLLGSGWVRTEGIPLHLTGAVRDGAPDIRSHGEFDAIRPTQTFMTRAFTTSQARAAAELARNLEEIFQNSGLRKLRSAISVFVNAFSQSALGDRIHQFIRAIDGITRCRRGRHFERRGALFVGEANREMLFELYTIRSNVEHFQDPSDELPRLAPADDVIRGHRRAVEAEAIARYVLTRVVGSRDMWIRFADEAKARFWELPADEQRTIWGPELDLKGETSRFDPSMVRDGID